MRIVLGPAIDQQQKIPHPTVGQGGEAGRILLEMQLVA